MGRTIFLRIVICCAFVALLWGCASFAKNENVLAVVNDSQVTEDDLGYALNIKHRKETLGTQGGSLDVSGYVEKLIDDRLVILEARRMGLDKAPGIREKLDAFILRESVVMLFNEEIVGKVSVTDEEIRDFYQKNFETFHLRIIETGSREDAEALQARLKMWEDFGDLAEKYSTHPTKQKKGEISYIRGALGASPEFEKVVLSLGQGQVSDPVEINKKFYLIKFEGSEDAPPGELDAKRDDILKAIRKKKEKERGDEYLQELRDRADIELNSGVISSIDMKEFGEKADQWKEDERFLARVYDKTFTVAELMAEISLDKGDPTKGGSTENFVNNWVNFKVVDHEALSRNYDETAALKEKTRRYENELLKRSFIETVVVQQIKLTDDVLEKYHEENAEQYRKPIYFRVQELFFEKKGEADEIEDAIRKGADFTWIAGRHGDEGGKHSNEMLAEGSLPKYSREVIRDMQAGEVSPVLETGDGRYVIFKLKARLGGEVIAFNEIKDRVRSDYVKDEIAKLTADYVKQLRLDSRISVNTKAIEALKQKLGSAAALDNTKSVK